MIVNFTEIACIQPGSLPFNLFFIQPDQKINTTTAADVMAVAPAIGSLNPNVSVIIAANTDNSNEITALTAFRIINGFPSNI